MSNRLFQGIIHQMRDTVDRVIGVLDENGSVIACSGANSMNMPLNIGTKTQRERYQSRPI